MLDKKDIYASVPFSLSLAKGCPWVPYPAPSKLSVRSLAQCSNLHFVRHRGAPGLHQGGVAARRPEGATRTLQVQRARGGPGAGSPAGVRRH